MTTTKGAKLTTVGFMMPPEFPAEAYDEVHSRLVKYKETHPIQWESFGLGWNGLAYRYRALAEYDEEFTASIMVSTSPAPEERYRQGKALFGFFVNAVSVIDCFFYSANCIASILKPNIFPLSKSEDLIIYPEKVKQRFAAEFSNDPLSNAMSLCVGNCLYKKMKPIRDVLTHRGAPPRKFYAGGDRDGLATMPNNVKAPVNQWQFDFAVDTGTTASRREWLSRILKDLIEAANEFCNREL